MSQENVNTIVECLLSDERLRRRFAGNRLGTIAALYLCGLTLTSDEVAMFVRSDTGMWFDDTETVAHRRH